MKIFTLAGALVLSGACRTAVDSRVVAVSAVEPVLSHVLEIDSARLPIVAGEKPREEDAMHRLVALVSQYFAHVGRVTSTDAAGAAIDVYAELPSPGYRLAAHVEPRPDEFLLVRLTVERDGTRADRAPFFALDAFEYTFRGLDALHPAQGGAMDAQRFDRLQREAAQLKAQDADPPLSLEEYSRSPRQISSAGGDTPYYSPSRGTPR